MIFLNEHQPYFKTRVLPTPDQSLIIFLGVRTAPGLGKKVTLPKFGGGGEETPLVIIYTPVLESTEWTFNVYLDIVQMCNVCYKDQQLRCYDLHSRFCDLYLTKFIPFPYDNNSMTYYNNIIII
jgi:hypothetical protein